MAGCATTNLHYLMPSSIIQPQGETDSKAVDAIHLQQAHIERARYLASHYRPSLKNTVRTFTKQAWRFLTAITSPLWKKRLTRAQYEARLTACLGCDQLQRTNRSVLGFCNACGCRPNKFSELTVKANLPGAKCPKGKWDGQLPAAHQT